MNSELLKTIESLKGKYSSDGFIIVGIGGSHARGDEMECSDLDLLYSIVNPAVFVSKYGGFGAFGRIADIKKEIEDEVKKKVDLISLSSLNSVGKKYILKDALYVD